MSQAKAVVKTTEVTLDQIKSSPYQPRLYFDLEDIRESIKDDGILISLTVREKDGYYELIDGERRLRLAKELRYDTVPCNIIDVDDETARRIVYKVNKQRKNYTPEEEATFFKKLVEEEGMKPYEIEIQFNVDHHWVQTCLNIWKFPKDIQENVFGLGDRPIPYRFYMSDIRELEPEINRNIETAIEMARQIIKERMTVDEKKAFLGRRRKKIDEETVEKAEEAIEEVAPELRKPETPEEFEEAAKALKKRAKELKTPEQILEEKRQKARKTLLGGRGDALSKVEKAKELGIDTAEFEKRIEKIKAKIVDDPDEAYIESKKLKGDIDKAIKDFKEKQREAEIRKKVKKEVEERSKEELMKDERFLEDATKKLVSKRKIESAEEAKKLFADLGLPPIDKQIEDIYAKRKPLVDVDSVWSPEEEIKFVKGFIKRKGLKCSICGESEIMWYCRHEFK